MATKDLIDVMDVNEQMIERRGTKRSSWALGMDGDGNLHTWRKEHLEWPDTARDHGKDLVARYGG